MSVSSSVIAPTTFRSVVIVSCSIACSMLATSYVACDRVGDLVVDDRVDPIVTLSWVITGCGGNACTVSFMSTTIATRSSIGTRRWTPGPSVRW